MHKFDKSKIQKGTAIILAALIALVGISGVFVCAASGDVATTVSAASASSDPASAISGADDSRVPVYKDLEELNGKRVGIQVGSILDKMVEESIPGARIEFFSTFPDEINALKASKIDGVATIETVITQVQAQDDSIAYIDEPIGAVPLGFVFPKNEEGKKLSAEMSEFLTDLHESGEMDRLKAMWNETDESLKVMEDYKDLPAENGTLTFVTEGTFPPFDYFRDGELVGYDVDVAIRFCKAYGYGIELKDMNFDALMPAVQSGKCDFAASGIAITEERKEKVYFSEPDYYQNAYIVVLAEEKGAGSFFESLKRSFYRTFIKEHRYRLFLKGIWVTLAITVLSIAFGTMLGFILYMWCRKGGRTANAITRFCIWLVQGMPAIVLLMILYYVVFGKADIDGIAVAVIGFTLTFAASVYSMILSGVNAIDYGQTEASYALGFTDSQTFFGIILPQAARHFMPAYKAEIVTLIKATAVVGYIAVQDLTKMGDIVRSSTYEAFFPLIAVAIMYFVLAGLLNLIADKLTVSVDPEKRSPEKILKGIKTK